MRYFAALVVAVVASAVSAQPARDCTAAEHRQFDFWIGEWEVVQDAGKPAGTNRITSIHGGCALHEEWRGTSGFTGSSLNIFDRERRRWHQTWVDSSGGLLRLEGTYADGAMTLSGVAIEAGTSEKRTLQRIRWTREPDGRVRQLWEASENDGKDWKVVFDGWYSKRR